MSQRKLFSLFIAGAMVLAAVSCKKDSTDASYPTLGGLTFDCPEFVLPGQVVRLTPKGVTHPDGEGIGYYWKVTPTMAKIDTTRYETGLDKDGRETDGSFEFQFTDTLQTCTVLCYAFASGYTGDSHEVKVAVVDGGLDRSITNTGIASTDPKVTYEGVDYYYASSKGLDWFRNNLAVQTEGAPYGNYPAASSVFGRYYTYEEALTACPEGWRLPTDEEWVLLCDEDPAQKKYQTIGDMASKLFADVSFNGEPMMEYWPNVGELSNSSRMSFIPAGFANLGDRSGEGYRFASFDGFGEYAAVWTSDTVPGEDGMAYYRYLVEYQPDFFVGKGDVKSFGASVRCVRKSL